MPAVPVTHIIGTLILISIMTSISLYTVSISNQVIYDTAAVSLQEIAEKVASEAVSLISMPSIDVGTIYYKVIEVPYAVNQKGYIIQIKEDNDGWKLVAYLNEYNTINGSAKLFFKSSDALVCETGTGQFIINSGGQKLKLIYASTLSSGIAGLNSKYRPVVWCKVTNNNGEPLITIGLGKLEVAPT